MAARLGELLVGAGVLTFELLEQGLRAQVMWGGRLGTNLIELGCVDLDALARALGTQHRMPAALGKHFERTDRELQQLLSPDVAEKFSCVPLARVGPDRHIVLATLGPLAPRALAIIADELVVEPTMLIPSVAAELRIRYHLERIYQIPRGMRFLRSRGKTIPPFPSFELPPTVDSDDAPAVDDEPVDMTLGHSTPGSLAAARPAARPIAKPVEPPRPAERTRPVEAPVKPTAPRRSEPIEPPAARPPARRPAEPIEHDIEIDQPELDAEIRSTPAVVEELDDLSGELDDEIAAAPTTEATGRDRRRYVPTLADAPGIVMDALVERGKLGRVSLRRVQLTSPPGSETSDASEPHTCTTLGEATRAIRRANGRDRVAELVMDTIERFAPVCEAALFLILRNEVAIGWKGFARSGAEIPQVAVPMEQPGIVPTVVRHSTTSRCNADELSELDDKLLNALGPSIGDLVVVPITIGGQVMCMIAVATAADASVAVVEAIAAAAGAAFARLMRDASR